MYMYNIRDLCTPRAMRFVQRLAKDCLGKANIKYSLLKKYNIILNLYMYIYECTNNVLYLQQNNKYTRYFLTVTEYVYERVMCTRLIHSSAVYFAMLCHALEFSFRQHYYNIMWHSAS